MEGWAKVFISGADGEAFLADDVHMLKGCIGCHGGQSGELTKDEAHVGIDVDPSEGAQNKCSDLCHYSDMKQYYSNSVHATQAGYKHLIEQRSGLVFSEHPEIEGGFTAGCSVCHASCGDCHVSQPKNVGGGLVSSHKFNRQPDMIRNCTACHGSRVGDEYRGLNDYAGADLHWVPGGMKCVDCHTAEEMHGDDSQPSHRYEVAAMPRCEDCHSDISNSNEWHSMHLDDLSCQVCHSQTYKSCNSCHVGQGITGSSYATFKIGRNPLEGLRGKKYAVLRHIPVSENTYEEWGLTTLDQYATVTTWKYASPHNIRLHTAQTDTTGGRSCNEACHGTQQSPSDVFLRAADLVDLPAAEQQANQSVIVPDGPPTAW